MTQEIKISIDEKTASGVYSNTAMIAHNENEFITDFIFVHPPAGKVNSRVIMSPSHSKRFMEALKTNIDLYEKKFGMIKETPEQPNIRIDLNNN